MTKINTKLVRKLFRASKVSVVKTIQSSFQPSPNFGTITVSSDKLNNTDLFLQCNGFHSISQGVLHNKLTNLQQRCTVTSR